MIYKTLRMKPKVEYHETHYKMGSTQVNINLT